MLKLFRKKNEEAAKANLAFERAISSKALQENKEKENEIILLQRKVEELEKENAALTNAKEIIARQNIEFAAEIKGLKGAKTKANNKLEQAFKDMANMMVKLDDYQKNIEVAANTMEAIKEICNKSKGATISKKMVLKELGEGNLWEKEVKKTEKSLKKVSAKS